ncbi:MAG TPA: AAA family ATPase [Terracidiphilus sp.]|jgi:uridine kinase
MTAPDQSKSESIPGRPVLVGIAGFSGSGKTTIARQLARALDGIHFPLDNYYSDLSHLAPEERARQNFDDPALIESPLLAMHVAALARGETIERPLYDFSTHTRIPDRTETIPPAPLLVVEGLFALFYPALLPLYHLRVYVDTLESISFERRLARDVAERGRTPESVRRQYAETVHPAALTWVKPSAAHADLTLDGAQDPDSNVEQVVGWLRNRRLLPALPD